MKKILVIDDTSLNLEIAVMQFSSDDVTTITSYHEAENILNGVSPEREATGRHEYDIVLVDLLMPYDAHGPGRNFQGQLAPIGIFLALQAAKNGTADVLLLTDNTHHDHPAGMCLDPMEGQITTIGNSRLVVSNGDNFIRSFEPSLYSAPLGWTEKSPTAVRGKNWRAAYEHFFEGGAAD